MMPLTSLRQELQGLELEVVHEIERNMLESKCHYGRATVVRILGRKGL
jgi:hypothetical protein